MKPGEPLGGKPRKELSLSDCEALRHCLQDRCDDRAPLAPALEAHAATCPECRSAVAVFRDLDSLLGSSLRDAPAPPVDLVPAIMALVREDVRRARARARLATGALVAAALAIASGLTFAGFDPVAGARGLAQDGLTLAQLVRAQLPSVPGLPGSLGQVPTLPSLGPAALVLAAVLFLAQLALLHRTKARARNRVTS